MLNSLSSTNKIQIVARGGGGEDCIDIALELMVVEVKRNNNERITVVIGSKIL